MSATYKQAVDKAIADHKIVIFSKSYCPYCARAKRLLTSEFAHLKDQIYIKELDESPSDGSKIQDYLQEKTGQRTVPNIFISQKHVGGCDAVVSKSKNELAALVAA